jgi:hypothetical protein
VTASSDRSSGRLRRAGVALAEALAFPLTTWRRTLVAGVVAAVTFVALVLSTFPGMAMQMLGADPAYLDEAVALLAGNVFETAGALGVASVFLYAVLTGVVAVDAATQVRVAGVRGASGVGGLVPGLLASGCASCGAGVLGLLGFSGALALLPFQGNLLRAAGIAVLLIVLARIGDPRRCSID